MTHFQPLRPPTAVQESADARPAIAIEAARFATLDQDRAETILDRHASDAVRGWRLDEATYWQRVKFHARQLRAAARSRTDQAAR